MGRKVALVVALTLAAAGGGSSAQAALLTSTTGAIYNGPVNADAFSAVLTGTWDVDCTSRLYTTVNGSANTGVVTQLTFSVCTPSCTVVTNLGFGGATFVFDKSFEPTTIRLQESISINYTCSLLGTCTVTTTFGMTGTFLDPSTQIDFNVQLQGNGASPCGTSPGFTATYTVWNVTLAHIG